MSRNFLDRLFDSLLSDGVRIIKKARDTKEAGNLSYNMRDAYGCAVYYNGKIVRKGYANDTLESKGIHKGWEKHGIAPNTGRGYLEDFFSKYKPERLGVFLVCVNAVYYAPILEEGRQNVNNSIKYRILSQTDYMFDNLSNKYKGSKTYKL